MIKCIVWDFDDTIIKSGDIKGKSFPNFFKEKISNFKNETTVELKFTNIDINEELKIFTNSHGIPIKDTLKQILININKNVERLLNIDNYCDNFIKEFNNYILDAYCNCAPYNGMLELIEYLNTKNIKQVIVSGSEESLIKQNLEQNKILKKIFYNNCYGAELANKINFNGIDMKYNLIKKLINEKIIHNNFLSIGDSMPEMLAGIKNNGISIPVNFDNTRKECFKISENKYGYKDIEIITTPKKLFNLIKKFLDSNE